MLGSSTASKAYYRLLLERFEDNVVDLEKINILCAIQMVVRA
jgi:hypothetical protein